MIDTVVTCSHWPGQARCEVCGMKPVEQYSSADKVRSLVMSFLSLDSSALGMAGMAVGMLKPLIELKLSGLSEENARKALDAIVRVGAACNDPSVSPADVAALVRESLGGQ